MKHLGVLLFFLGGAATADQPGVSECFKVHNLLKMDEDHYWADWSNACPYTIDSVYVMVGFADRSRNPVGSGVWSLHYIKPGTARVIRFSTPQGVENYEYVHVTKITADMEEALRTPSRPIEEARPVDTLALEQDHRDSFGSGDVLDRVPVHEQQASFVASTDQPKTIAGAQKKRPVVRRSLKRRRRRRPRLHP